MSGTHICILGSPQGWYVERLQKAAEKHASVARVDCLQFGELAARVNELPGEGSACDAVCDSQISVDVPQHDAVIVRSMPLGTLEQVIFRMDCLQVLQDRGTLVVNDPKSLEVAIDKWLTIHRLHHSGLNVPATIACQSRDQGMQAYDLLGGNVVVKPLFGGEGRGILHVRERDMAWRVFSTLEQLGNVAYVQQFHEHIGYDIRVLFIGESHFSYRRCSAGSFRTNLSQGSRAEQHELSEQELSMARRAARAIGGRFVGVDLLPCKDGETRILEVNAVPGWKGVEQVCHVDVAQLVITDICQLRNA